MAYHMLMTRRQVLVQLDDDLVVELGYAAGNGRSLLVKIWTKDVDDIHAAARSLIGPAFDFRDHLVGRRAHAGRQEIRHEEQDETQGDNGQGPLQPAFVPPHPVEHGHGSKSSGKRKS